MRKALKAATLMGLAAALIVPAAPSAKAADMEMGSTKVTIGGQLRQRIEWWAQEVGTGKGAELGATYRARLNIKAELSDGVTVVFTPQAVGYWGEGGQGLGLGEYTSFTMHEAYMLLSNPFGINNVIVKMGRQEVNLGNQRLVGAVGWSQAGRSIDGILIGYVAGDYGLAGFFYGKLNDLGKGAGPWFSPQVHQEPDIDLYVATWQGKFKPFGIGGTYEITDIYVNPTSDFTRTLGKPAVDTNVNTIYGRVTPAFETDMAKIKLNLEAAYQSGDFGNADFGGYMFSIGAGADFTDVAWAPGVFIGYDYYSGDDDPTDSDLDAFWSVLPTAHKWLGHADTVWVSTPFYQFNDGGLVHVALQEVGNYNVAGVKDLYFKFHAKPMDKVALGLDIHYFTAAEDVLYKGADGKWKTSDDKNLGDDIGWEADFSLKYKYSKNLCLTIGYDYFDPDDAFKAILGDDEQEHHIWAQADLKF